MSCFMRLSLSIAFSLLTCTSAIADHPIRGVVELFTSQGCSSCPPADALFEELAQQRGLAVLSLPVDYWDRLGWKDTYGSPAHSARQRGYAVARGDRAVYTPQAVVNGARHMNGVDRSEIEASLDQSRSSLTVPLDVSRSSATLRITVGAAPTTAVVQPATLVLIPYLARREVKIGRGESAKRAIAYTNIARKIEIIGTWFGKATTIERPVTNPDAADGAFILLQTGTPEAPGPIIGAAQISFAN